MTKIVIPVVWAALPIYREDVVAPFEAEQREMVWELGLD